MEEKGVESVNQALETARKSQLRNGEIAELQIQERGEEKEKKKN